MIRKIFSILLGLVLAVGLLLPSFVPPSGIVSADPGSTETLRPNAPGDDTQFTPYPAVPNWQNVDEVSADDGTTYINTPRYGTNLRDLYNLPASSGAGTINFIKIYFRCTDGDVYGGLGYVKPSLKSNSTVTDGTQISLTAAYVTYSQQWNTNPAPPGTDAWTWADIDALQIGVNSAATGDGICFCTQVYVVIDYTAAPTVTTSAASLIEETTATLNGSITSTGGQNADLRGFDWGLTDVYGDSWTEGTPGSYVYGTGAFNHGITGLTQGTLYHFRAKARNSAGWGYGSDTTFTTKPEAPTNLNANTSASGTIHLTWSKGTDAQKTYIRGEAGSYPTDRTDGYEVYNDTGTSCDDTGLTGGTTYYYRAWSEAGGSYSDAYSEDFSLAIEKPSVTTNAASIVTGTSATLNTQITNTGGESATSRGFVWDTTSKGDPGNTAPVDSNYANNWKEDGSYGVASFSHSVSSLDKGETYYFRGCAYNPTGGWSYGSELSFNTLDLVLWFQPNAMISGTTLVDRAGTQNGVITWGSNPSGISITTGSLTLLNPTRISDVALEEEGLTLIPEPPEEPESYYVDPDYTRLPGQEAINELLTAGQIPIKWFWTWLITAIVIVLGFYVYDRTRHLMGMAIACGCALIFIICLGMLDGWVMLIYGIIATGLCVSEKSTGW